MEEAYISARFVGTHAGNACVHGDVCYFNIMTTCSLIFVWLGFTRACEQSPRDRIAGGGNDERNQIYRKLSYAYK
jgi:hypothetical protein